MTRGARHFQRSQAIHAAQSMWLARVERLEADNLLLRGLLAAAVVQFPHDDGWLHDAQNYFAGDPATHPEQRT